jgi:hypothetical protein
MFGLRLCAHLHYLHVRQQHLRGAGDFGEQVRDSRHAAFILIFVHSHARLNGKLPQFYTNVRCSAAQKEFKIIRVMGSIAHNLTQILSCIDPTGKRHTAEILIGSHEYLSSIRATISKH